MLKNVFAKRKIRNYFRVILGREVDTEGLKNFYNLIKDNRMEIATLREALLASDEFAYKYAASAKVKYNESQLNLVDLGEYEMYTSNSDTSIGQQIRDQHDFEPHISKIIDERLKPGMNVLDIGANIGYFSLLCANKLRNSGKVFCIEASQDNAKLILLSASCNAFSNITVFPYAVTNFTGWLQYQRNVGSNGVAFDADFTESDFQNDIVPCIRIDEIIKEKIDIIKIDIEGGEYLALKGAEELLRKHRPIVISECSSEMLRRVSKVSVKDYFDYMQGLGYTISLINRETLKVENKPIEELIEYFENNFLAIEDLLLEYKNLND